jgi:hypothetical protein
VLKHPKLESSCNLVDVGTAISESAPFKMKSMQIWQHMGFGSNYMGVKHCIRDIGIVIPKLIVSSYRSQISHTGITNEDDSPSSSSVIFLECILYPRIISSPLDSAVKSHESRVVCSCACDTYSKVQPGICRTRHGYGPCLGPLFNLSLFVRERVRVAFPQCLGLIFIL